MRDMAAGRPGLLTKTGLNTFVDPRQQGARQSPRTPPDFVDVVNLAGEEWLFFKPVPVSVAFLRGTTADEDGNVTMEEEAVLGEMLAMAQATRRAGGIVIVQVKRMARRGTLPGKHVRIPGILVDFIVVDAEQRQTYATYYDPSYSGELRIPHRSPRRDGARAWRRVQSRCRRLDRPVDNCRRGRTARRRGAHQ
jgi:propionate CoA-transferase